MEDTYVYVSVKLCLKPGQTGDSIQGIIQELDYSFTHEDILGHEIMDIIDIQIPNEPSDPQVKSKSVDPFDMAGLLSH